MNNLKEVLADLTPERRAHFEELLKAMPPFKKKKPKPQPKPRPMKLVCVNGVIIADAVVIVSEKDPNWWRAMAVRTNGVMTVRRI